MNSPQPFNSSTPQHSSEPSRFSKRGWVILFLVVALLIGWAFLKFHQAEHRVATTLPDLVTVPDFSFTTQEGKLLTKADLAGKIWIADFIFTQCAGPCPIMTSRMAELSSRMAKVPDVRLVSVSVDPEHDTPEVLAHYAANVHANPVQWSFLTGSAKEIADFTIHGMKQSLVMEPGGMPTHSTRLMIVDGHGIVRAYYDGNDPEVVQKILIDVGDLLREQNKKL
ncbi:MAG: SCO family protein [Chthoniobacterales bacterium]